MKKFLRILAISVIFATLTISCRSDDDDAKNTNPIPQLNGFFQVNGGTSYPINSAIVQGLNSPNPGTAQKFYRIAFTHYDQNLNTKVADLALFFPSNTTIDGNYSINGNTRILDDWMTSYSEGIAGSSMDSYNDLSAGTCTIVRTGNKFKVNFSYTVAGGKVISGQFDDIAEVQE